jgi:hypothetical protein
MEDEELERIERGSSGLVIEFVMTILGLIAFGGLLLFILMEVF